MLDLNVYSARSIMVPSLTPAKPEKPAQAMLFESEQPDLPDLPDPLDLVRQGALVVCSHSAGKDSQAMLIHMIERLSIPAKQIVVVHADLGEAEWEGTELHARQQAEHYGCRFFVTRAIDKAGNTKELLDYVDTRGQFMSSSARFCTSDWKRGPIRREINRIRELTNHQSPYVLNAMGMRSQESAARSKLEPLEFVKDASCPSQPWPLVLNQKVIGRRRAYFDWHPILHYTEDQVFATIEAAGQI